MEWKIWLGEHIVEIISLLVSLAGFSFAGYYLHMLTMRQNITLKGSKNNTIIQISNIKPEKLTEFKSKVEKETSILVDSIPAKQTEEPKELLTKIKNFLEEEKSISTVAEVCLRLARKLDMKEDISWLSKEVNGFSDEVSEGGLDFKNTKGKEYKDYRKVEAKLYLQTPQQISPDEFSFRMFISEPLKEVELWVDQNKNCDPMVMRIAPLKLMVETLGVSPNEKVPYIVNGAAIKKILVGARIELNKFIERSEEKLKKDKI